MIWIHVEDYFYYKKKNFNLLIEKISFNNSEVGKKLVNSEHIMIYDKNSLIDLLKASEEEKVIISPFLPKDFNMDSSFFGILNVDNTKGMLTESEDIVGMKDYDKLNDKLGLIVEQSPFTFEKDHDGDVRIAKIIEQLNLRYMFGEIPNAVFLAGIMGTGKSFFAQCLAGETGRLLVSFNLAKIMNESNPIKAFDSIISYLLKQKDAKYLLWIDEIDKIFNNSKESEHIKNKFLTFLNDLGITISIDAFVVMTANDVTDILTKFPEMIRAGRVEPYAKVFLDFHSKETAIRSAELCINKKNSDKYKRKVLSNCMYYSYMNEKLINKKNPENKIIESVIEKIEKIKQVVFDLESRRLNKQEIIKYLESSLEGIFNNQELEDIFNILEIKFSGFDVIDFIDRVYKTIHRESKLDGAFYYVHAEIKEIVNQIYYLNIDKQYSSENHEELHADLRKIVKDNIAIGDAGEKAVNSMLGNKDKFSIIVD